MQDNPVSVIIPVMHMWWSCGRVAKCVPPVEIIDRAMPLMTPTVEPVKSYPKGGGKLVRVNECPS